MGLFAEEVQVVANVDEFGLFLPRGKGTVGQGQMAQLRSPLFCAARVVELIPAGVFQPRCQVQKQADQHRALGA